MRKEQLLEFIPNPDEKYASTHKIALAAHQHDFLVHLWLVELENMPRPLVKHVEFGKKRRNIMWKKTKIEKNLIDAYSKIPIENRDSNEHNLILRDKYGGNLRAYIQDILKEKGVING